MARKRSRRRPLIDRFHQRYRSNGDSAAFIRNVASCYTTATLERLALSGNRRCRRGAALALGMLGDFSVNATLGKLMTDKDRGVRLLAEQQIRNVWCCDGEQEQRQRIQQIMRLNANGQVEEALQLATELIEQAPSFAEAWNQRAVAYFLLDDFGRSARDCHQTLELNPYHFGAAVGMGHCYLELNEGRLALEAFRRALKLNPSLEGIRAQVKLLEQTLEGK